MPKSEDTQLKLQAATEDTSNTDADGSWDSLVEVSEEPRGGTVIDMEPVGERETLLTISPAGPNVTVESTPIDAGEAMADEQAGLRTYEAGEEPLATFASSDKQSPSRAAAPAGEGLAAAGRKSPRSWRRDETLLEAVHVARESADEVAHPRRVGDHLGAVMVGDKLAMHRFASADPGYPDWLWEVSLARAPRSKTVTVCEVNLVPGSSALLAPKWVPWSERLEPGDVSRSDVLPYEANDSRLQAGFEQTQDAGADVHGIDEIGLGRPRVLSQEGIDEAAQRWYDSPRGPVPGTKPSAMCVNCGFLTKMQGSLGTLFGVCANGWSPDDGGVVSFDHTCGAHSETGRHATRPQWPIVPSRIDDNLLDDESE